MARRPTAKYFLPVWCEFQKPSCVTLVNFFLVRWRVGDGINDADGFADESRPLLRIERHIRAEKHAVDSEERQPAFGGADGAEDSRVGIEHAEVINGAALQAVLDQLLFRIRRACAQLIESGSH